MDPRRPVVAVGQPPAVLSRHGSVSSRTPRTTQIEPFEQDAARTGAVARPSPRHSTLEKRASLRTMHFGSTPPSAELLTVTLTPRAPSGGLVMTRRLDETKPSPPGECLASLRAKTLLDYDFMREFSLAKRKPVEDRNLSRMSASSLYSMRMAQIELDDQARRLQRLELPLSSLAVPSASKADGEIRGAAAATRTPVVSPSPPPSFRRSLSTLRRQPRPQDEASSCFPTLWNPSDAAANTGVGAVLKLKYRQSQPPSSPAGTSSPASEPPSKLTARKHHGHATLSTPSGSLLSDGLSDFDLRKCHPASSVTAQHGFLQEQDLPKLLEETGYDRTELYGLWARFKALCAIAKSPKGIDKETFRRGIPQLSIEDHFFIDRVFDILDADGSGILEWQEFVEALSALEKGDVVKRVGFLFRVYDLNGDGSTINRDEVMRFFLTSLLVETTDELVEVAKHFVGKIFDAVGCGDVDTMRIEDALRYMNEHPSADIYSLFGRTMVTKQRATGFAASSEPQNSARARPEG